MNHFTKEAQIEEKLIAKLQDLKYTYRKDIRDKESLEQNFREKFEALNGIRLSDAEFLRLRDEIVTSDTFAASQALREKGKFNLDDGTPFEYTLVNVKDWCKNEYEVINQLRINTENSFHRYDVILLINGLPLVQIELKTYDLTPRKAMEQIVKYKNDPGNGYGNTLLCFMQLFIVSNGNDTRYFANNRKEHFNFDADERFLPIYRHADRDNNKIAHLHDFADDFLVKCTLGQLISRYMVLVQSEQKILIMRPYQIYAVKAIVDAIHENRGNGYIWHTTGSGKTLTSFKASTLLKDNPDIEKCLFVVDRKDLDRQTRDEFNKFQKDCVEQNTNTGSLVQRMLSDDYGDKVIVTTIQKLGLALDGSREYKEQLKTLADKRVVFIFDECHRSQFGENHKAIKEFFPKAQLFGFTGTPIFEDNSTYRQAEGEQGFYKTTKDIFEKELHAYTITHAIEDRNVLSFHVDYFRTQVKGKDVPKANPPTPEVVIQTILEKHPSVTNNRKFNAIFATASINEAINYYQQFQQVQKDLAKRGDYIPLNIACVFSPPAQAVVKDVSGESSQSIPASLVKNVAQNAADIRQLQEDLPQELLDNQVDPEGKKKALIDIIADYNAQYSTNHSINDFDAYYKDVQERIKHQQYVGSGLDRKQSIDITIVVDMLLTGFDSKFLNTLYVDKNMKHHGLIQAFSRTNRVLNDSKPWGNVLDFRSQEAEVDFAIGLFSGQARDKARTIWLVPPAKEMVAEYEKKVEALERFMKNQGLTCEPSSVVNLKGDSARAEYASYFKEIQRIKTSLDQYSDLDEESKEIIEEKLPVDTYRGHKAMYLDIAKDFKQKQDKGGETSDEVEQLDLELVLFNSAVIDYDYILSLMAKSTQGTTKQGLSQEQIIELIQSDSKFMLDREDLIEYVKSLKSGEVKSEREIHDGFQTFKAQKASEALKKMAKAHKLKQADLEHFVQGILDRMIFDGELLTDLFAPLDLGWKERRNAEESLMEDLVPYLIKQSEGREISGLSGYG